MTTHTFLNSLPPYLTGYTQFCKSYVQMTTEVFVNSCLLSKKSLVVSNHVSDLLSRKRRIRTTGSAVPHDD